MNKKLLFVIIFGLILVIGGINQLFVVQQSENDNDIKEPNTNQHAPQKKQNKQQQPKKKAKEGTVKERVDSFFKRSKDVFANKDTHVVAIGDSLTQGVGDTTNSGGYVGVLDEIVNDDQKTATFDNFGHAGDRTDQLLKRMKDPRVQTSLKRADIVLITVGANDIMKILRDNITDLNYKDFKKEQPAYEERLTTIFDNLSNLNDSAEIYLVGFYNPFEQYFADVPELDQIVEDWNSIGEKVTSTEAQFHYIPTKDLFDKAEKDLFYEDNFHPNNDGYEKMAERVLNYIDK